jgi:hypothetical protein
MCFGGLSGQVLSLWLCCADWDGCNSPEARAAVRGDLFGEISCPTSFSKHIPAEVLKPGIRSLTANALLEVSLKRAAEEEYVEVNDGYEYEEEVGVCGGERKRWSGNFTWCW